MAKKQIGDERVEATQEIYRVAREQADQEMAKLREQIDSIRQESFAMGAIKAFDTNIAQNEFLKIMALYRIKQAKDYKSGGFTWKEFCEAIGVPDRTIDRMIEEAKPYFEMFSAGVAEIAGLPFNKIRQLGKTISANGAEIKDNCLVYGDETIPLTPEYRDDIQALIERIGDEAKEKLEEAEAQLSAKDKVLKSKTDLLNKQERALKKYENEAAAKGLTPDEDAFLQLMSNKSTSFEGYMLAMDPDFVMGNAGDITPRMRACLIATHHYMKMQVLAAYDTAVLNYGSPDLNPELMEEFEQWEKAQGLQTQG